MDTYTNKKKLGTRIIGPETGINERIRLNGHQTRLYEAIKPVKRSSYRWTSMPVPTVDEREILEQAYCDLWSAVKTRLESDRVLDLHRELDRRSAKLRIWV